MASTRYDFPITTTPDDILERIRRGLGKARGTLTGDGKAGTFEVPSPFGPVRGRYEIPDGGQVLYVFVDEKPAFLADSLVESYLREYVK